MEILASSSPGRNTNERYAAALGPAALPSSEARSIGCWVELHPGQNPLLQAEPRSPVRTPFGPLIQRIWQRTFPYLLKLTFASVCVFRCYELLWSLCNTHQSAQRFTLRRTGRRGGRCFGASAFKFAAASSDRA